MRVVKCLYCEKDFEPQGSRVGYCSVRCGANARKDRSGRPWENAIADGFLWWALRWKKCIECGKYCFGRTDKKFCSEKCHNDQVNRKVIKYKGKGRPLCPDCGAEYEPRSSSHPGARCIACNKEHKIRVRRLTKKLFGNHRKRAKTYGVPYEPIKATEIYKRDKYRCQICGKKVDPTASPPNPLTPTIDHIIPMSRGGGHVWGNVQCACFECNCCHKRDTIKEETQMVLC